MDVVLVHCLVSVVGWLGWPYSANALTRLVLNTVGFGRSCSANVCLATIDEA